MLEKCYRDILELLSNEVKPALGCTEPIAVALATAKANEVLTSNGFETNNILVNVSPNILKNGMGVGVPGTGMVGLHIAAALGTTCGKSEYKLEVLKHLNDSSIEKAKKIVSDQLVKISLANTEKKLYIEGIAIFENNYAKVVIEDNHDNITLVEFNGVPIIDNSDSNQEDNDSKIGKSISDYNLTLDKIYDFVLNVPIDNIRFMLDSKALNIKLSENGLTNEYGLMVGKVLSNPKYNDIFGNGLMLDIMSQTAAASDARMAGCTLPAMSNSGSGNQGITVTIPVIATANKLGSTEDQLIRALALSHLIAIHIKGHLGKLSALCGCVIASTGAACGIVFLNGGSLDQISFAIKNMIGNITGMVCDGAKVGCALKVASGVSSALQSAILALENISISSNDGIIDDDIEKTIHNLGIIGSIGMQYTDQMILDIMKNK